MPEAHPSPGEHIGTWERLSFAAAHAVLSGMLLVLSTGGLYRFGCLFGTIEWLIDYRRRRRFAIALTRVLGRKPAGAERRKATREHFMRSRCDKLFYLIFDRLPRKEAMSLLVIENRELFDAAIARGCGVYVAMSHHGPYHVLGMLMALHGYKTAAVRDRNEGGIRRYVQHRYNRLYPEFGQMRVIYEDGFAREIYRCFRDKFALGSAMDVSRVRRPNQKAVDVTIFGERRRFLTGPLMIALRCGAPVLQAFIFPEPGFRYRFHIVGMLVDPDEVEDEDAAVETAVRTYAANVERYVRNSPSLLSRL